MTRWLRELRVLPHLPGGGPGGAVFLEHRILDLSRGRAGARASRLQGPLSCSSRNSSAASWMLVFTWLSPAAHSGHVFPGKHSRLHGAQEEH